MAGENTITTYGIAIDPAAAEQGAQRTAAALDQVDDALARTAQAAQSSAEDMRAWGSTLQPRDLGPFAAEINEVSRRIDRFGQASKDNATAAIGLRNMWARTVREFQQGSIALEDLRSEMAFMRETTAQSSSTFDELDRWVKQLRADHAAGAVGAEEYRNSLQGVRAEAIAMRQQLSDLSGKDLAAFTRLMQQTTEPAAAAARGMGTVTRNLTQMAATAAGVPGPLGRIASSLSRLAGPGGWLALAAGSVVGLTLAYRGLTRRTRERADEQERMIAGFGRERREIETLRDAYERVTNELGRMEDRRRTLMEAGPSPGAIGARFATGADPASAVDVAGLDRDVAAASQRLQDFTAHAVRPLADELRGLGLEHLRLSDATGTSLETQQRVFELQLRQRANLEALPPALRQQAELLIQTALAQHRANLELAAANDRATDRRRTLDQEGQERRRLVDRILEHATALDIEASATAAGASDGAILVRQLTAQATAAGIAIDQVEGLADAIERIGTLTDDLVARQQATRDTQQREQALARLITRLEEEHRALTVGADALVRYQAAQLGAGAADQARIRTLQRLIQEEERRDAIEAQANKVVGALKASATESAEAYEVVWRRALENTQDAFASFFASVVTDGVDSFQDLASRVLAVWSTMIANLLAKDLFASVLGSLFTKSPQIPGLLPELPADSFGGPGIRQVVPTPVTSQVSGLVGSGTAPGMSPLDPDAMIAAVHRGGRGGGRSEERAAAGVGGVQITIPVQALDGRDVVRALRAHTPELLAILAPYLTPDVRAFGNQSRRR